jgi:hypothetical protein
MSKSYDLFLKNLESVNVIDNIYGYFSLKVGVMDLSEILRSQYVLLVSAFDYYIHDIVKEGMLEIFEGVKSTNKNYDQFSISLEKVRLLLSATCDADKRAILDTEIRRITFKDSYQAPRSVESALNLIDIKSVWSVIRPDLGISSDDIKTRLGLIVHRRNKIAHEADMDPITGRKSDIDRDTIIEVRDFLHSIVSAVDRRV